MTPYFLIIMCSLLNLFYDNLWSHCWLNHRPPASFSYLLCFSHAGFISVPSQVPMAFPLFGLPTNISLCLYLLLDFDLTNFPTSWPHPPKYPLNLDSHCTHLPSQSLQSEVNNCFCDYLFNLYFSLSTFSKLMIGMLSDVCPIHYYILEPDTW